MHCIYGEKKCSFNLPKQEDQAKVKQWGKDKADRTEARDKDTAEGQTAAQSARSPKISKLRGATLK